MAPFSDPKRDPNLEVVVSGVGAQELKVKSVRYKPHTREWENGSYD